MESLAEGSDESVRLPGDHHLLVRRDEDETETGRIHEGAPIGLEKRGIDELAVDAFVGIEGLGFGFHDAVLVELDDQS
jgi:hypothetical protein